MKAHKIPDFPMQVTIKKLHGFFGLTSYLKFRRKFIQNSSTLAAPVASWYYGKVHKRQGSDNQQESERQVPRQIDSGRPRIIRKTKEIPHKYI